MNIKQISDKYLNTLYFKSKDDFGKGYNENKIAEMIGLDESQGRNVINYLEQKNLAVSNPMGYDIKLTADGIDYITKLRENMIFKTVRFIAAKYLHSSRDAVEYLFYYDIIDEDNSSERKSIKVSISGSLACDWGFDTWSNNPDIHYKELMKILLLYGKDKIAEKIKEGTLNEFEEIMLLTSSEKVYKPESANLVDLDSAEFEIAIEQKVLSEEMQENKLAASIIETRDIINSIFKKVHSERLLLLNEERNLLDFFKSAKSEEEYSHRLASLGQVSRHLNVSILRTLTEEKDTQIGSVGLLENFLSMIGKSDKNITDCLKQIGRIRQGYPVHSDISAVITGYNYFGLTYPVDNYELAWTTLLNYYLNSLKLLKEILADKYLISESNR